MSTSICTQEEIKLFLDESLGGAPGNLTCEYLKAEHGISLGVQQDGYFLVRENRYGRPMLRATLSKTSGALLGPMIAMLDAKAASGFVVITLKINVMECSRAMGDFSWAAKVQNMMSQKDYVGVLISLAERKECDFSNLFKRIKDL
mgnify:CR=1 FL=1